MTLPLVIAPEELTILVIGKPAPQGSKRAFVRGNHAVLVEQSRNVAPWRSDVTAAAQLAVRACRWIPLDGPVAVDVTFRIARPASAKRTWPHVAPDLDKLVRSTFDALKVAGALVDDSRVVELAARKRYAQPGQPTGASIRVTQNLEGS